MTITKTDAYTCVCFKSNNNHIVVYFNKRFDEHILINIFENRTHSCMSITSRPVDSARCMLRGAINNACALVVRRRI